MIFKRPVCPNCSNEDLDKEAIPVFGDPGYLTKYYCYKCYWGGYQPDIIQTKFGV